MLPTAAALAGELAVWAIDLPGFGRTPRTSEEPSVSVLADVVEAWVDAHGLDRPLLVANSLGCQVAAELLARRIGAFAGAVLTGPTPDPAAPTVLRQAWRLARVAPREPLRHNLRATADYLRHGPLYVLRTAQLALEDPVREKLALVRRPVAVVRGEYDTIAPEPWGREVANRTGGTFDTIPGRGHAVTYSAPEAVAEIALALLRERA